MHLTRRITPDLLPSCRDQNGNCGDWASHQECDKNPAFMREACPVSCNDCTPPELNVESFMGQILVLSTEMGDIRIRPLFDKAPRTAALILDLAHQPGCPECNIYRSEALPAAGDGPPYGLVQGSLSGLLRTPPREGGSVVMRRGDAAMIPGTREFFLNLMDHPGWGDAMTVWGRLVGEEDLAVAEAITALPFHATSSEGGATVMRLLDAKIVFTPTWERDADMGGGGEL
ncbi:MAG: hypothetical protein WDW36_008899 [Sanguina aurantia]